MASENHRSPYVTSQTSDHVAATRLPIERCEPDILQQLHEYWDSARGGAPWLPHAQMRPESFAYALPYVALVDRPPPDGKGLRIRLVGEGIRNEQFGYVRGALIEDMTGPAWYRDHLIARYREAFREAAPSFETVRVFHDYRRIFYNRLLLPLTSAGNSADILMIATANINPPATRLEPEDRLA